MLRRLLARARERRPRSYGELWRPRDEDEARNLILNTRDAEAFELSGRQQAEALCRLIRPEDTVLDLGCGVGRVARYVASCCGTLWAVDASETMLRLARERLGELPNVRFARCTGTAIPDLRDDEIDFAYSILTLQHLEREDAFALVREVRRVLKPGGSAFFTFPNLLSDQYLESFVNYVDAGEVRNPARARFYTPEEVQRLLPAAGFEPVHVADSGTDIEITCR